jgi:predicted dehydrogenase
VSERRRVLRAVPRIGVLGAARIVPKALLVPAQGLADVVAVAARDAERARVFADTHDIPDAHGTYEELLERSDLDAVYIALPAAHHARWTLAALGAGKNVLCEKPFGLAALEAATCVARATEAGLLLMEAHHWRYHPLIDAFSRALVEVGPLSEVRALFDAPIRAGNIRLDPALGAGVLLDFGCYLLQWLMLAAADDEPTIAQASAIQGDAGIDMAFSAVLRAHGGARLWLSCDMRPDVTFTAFVEAIGERGQVRFENPLNGEDARLIIQRGAQSERIEAAGPTTYRRQVEAFVHALHAGTDPPTSGASIVRTQSLLDELYQAAGLPARAVLARSTTG